MVNVAMLTTGANFPAIDLLAFMRPTRSPVLYVQMAGRGTRLHPNKTNCLLLDFGGVVEELGPIDAIKVREPGPGGGEAPIKFCPGILANASVCNAQLPASQMTCPHCGYKFPDPGLNLSTTASDAAVLSDRLKPKIKIVNRVGYYRHKKEGKPDTLRVDYLCGYDTYREWVHLEHVGFPRERACNWWKLRANTTPPRTIDEALKRTSELMVPANISVKKIGKYFEITDHHFGYIEEEEQQEEEQDVDTE
jgi:DNA repair protein RadD